MNDLELTVDGTTYTVRIDEPDPATPEELRVEVDGTAYTVRCSGLALPAGPAAAPALPAAPPRPAPARRSGGAAGQVCAPMPGTVLSVKVEVGASVAAGDTLLMLEAMKMETAVPAPSAGTVSEVLVKAGQRVNTGEPLVTLGAGS